MQAPCAQCQPRDSIFFYLFSWVGCCFPKALCSITLSNIMITGHRGLFNFKSLKIKCNLRFMSRESHISSVPLPPCWCPPYQPVHAWVFPPRQEVPWDSTAVGHHALCFHPPTTSSQDQIKHRATRTVGQTTLHTLSLLSKRESRGRETQSHNHLP